MVDNKNNLLKLIFFRLYYASANLGYSKGMFFDTFLVLPFSTIGIALAIPIVFFFNLPLGYAFLSLIPSWYLSGLFGKWFLKKFKNQIKESIYMQREKFKNFISFLLLYFVPVGILVMSIILFSR